MDARAVERIWGTRLQPWLQSQEAHRSKAATRFLLIGLPGIALAAVLAWYTLLGTGELLLAAGAFLFPAAGIAWIGYGPLARLQAELQVRMLAAIAEAFDFTHPHEIAGGFPVQRFHDLDLVYSSPGSTFLGFGQTRDGRQIDVVTAEFTYPRQDEHRSNPWLTDFTGVLIRMKLKRSLASEVVLTRQVDWFSELSRTGASFLANRLDLVEVGKDGAAGPFKAYCADRAVAEAILTDKLAAGLKALEAGFRGQPIRLALVPEADQTICLIAAHSLRLIDNTSILEPLDQRSRVQPLIAEMAAISDLIDLIIRHVDLGAESEPDPKS